ncbi:MAG TPA: hypothetical protein PK419_09560 [Spirochaetota bacterium]|nr:hypothetical protein [Spirochaetota bacterium]HQA53089.1 hypothetical protein [Spirochaetota bacterium]
MQVNLLIVFMSAGFFLGMIYLFRIYRIYSIPKRIEKAKGMLAVNDEKALAILNAVLNLDKTNTDANWLVSKYNFDKKHFILALMTLQDMLKYDRYTPEIMEQDVREMLARIYLLLGNVEKAMEQFNTMSRKWAMPSSILKTAIKMQLESGYFAEAKKLCKEGSDLYPADGEFPFTLGVISFRAKDFPSAESRFLEAERKNYYSGEINLYLAKIYFASGQFDRALERVENVHDLEEGETEKELLKAKINLSLGNVLQALSVFEEADKKVKEEDLYFSEFSFYYAEALESAGSIESAVNRWNSVKDSSPHYNDARDKLFFYKNIGQDKLISKILSMPSNMFDSLSQSLLSHLDYNVKSVLFKDDRLVCYNCSSKRDSHMFGEYIVFSTRITSPVNEAAINNYISRARYHNIDKVVIIAPMFSDDCLAYASSKNIIIYGFDAFFKNNIAQKFFNKK